MRNYGVIHSRYWTWAQEQGLDVYATLMGAYLLSCDHSNSAGCYRIPLEYIASDLGQTVDRVSTACQQLINTDFMAYCPCSKWILIKKYLFWNPAQNLSHSKAIIKMLKQVPSSFGLIDKLQESLKQFGVNTHLTKDMIDDLIDTLSNRVSTQCRLQDQDQDQDQDVSPLNPPRGKTAKKKDPPYRTPTGADLIHEYPWINIKAWDEFVQHRQDIRHPLTELAVTKTINILAKNKHQQQDMVDKAIHNNYRGLWGPNGSSVGKTTNQSKADRIKDKYVKKYRFGSGETDRQDAVDDGALLQSGEGRERSQGLS